jgi:aminoglycoside phosphotransferase (APT) family kinase protein
VSGPRVVDVVETAEAAARLELPPLLVLQPLERFLDGLGLGAGPLRAAPVGEGNSNVTYLLEREGARAVLRRPPRPPLPPSAHDVLREARVQQALGRAGARVPRILAACDDESLLGVPFYLMEPIDGVVVTETIPAELDVPAGRRRIGEELVDALVEIHAVDCAAAGLEDFGRPTGYLRRQLRRFAGLWEVNATRDLPAVLEVAGRLEATAPESPPATVVHGDYRLGNTMLAPGAPARLLAVLDWELSTIGDPLADVGYLVATWTEAASPRTALDLSPVTGAAGFPSRVQLANRYAERSGRELSTLPWYEALALWKAAVFCEAIYGRYRAGERDDPWSASLADGVPRLVEAAAERIEAL